MGNRTGRKTIADPKTRERALAIAKSNPSMSASQIAERLPSVSTRQVQYWLQQAKKNGDGLP
jgi:transposase